MNKRRLSARPTSARRTRRPINGPGWPAIGEASPVPPGFVCERGGSPPLHEGWRNVHLLGIRIQLFQLLPVNAAHEE